MWNLNELQKKKKCSEFGGLFMKQTDLEQIFLTNEHLFELELK